MNNLPDPSKNRHNRPNRKANLPSPIPPPPPLPPDEELSQDQKIQLPAVSTYQAVELKRLLVEKAKRQVEALKLYEPLPRQEEFHSSRCRQRLLRGSNRGGKTLPAAVEFARAVCGMDPHGKYPKRDGRAFAVGKNLDHVGSVMWYKLSRAGAFKIIRDLHTNQWRAFRPWEMEDAIRAHLAKPAPPLIPPRLIKQIAWENKAKNIPKMVRLHTGWEITFYSSEGKPPQGQDIDYWWFDEEITDPDWYPEMVMRTLDRHGCGVWSATPQAGTERLLELHERADREHDLPNPGVREFVILLADNPFFTAQEKQDMANSLSEEEQLVRIGGEFAINAYKVFPEFNMIAHGVDWFEIPPNWTRYAVVDPGRQVCAVLFAAVPPPSVGRFVYLYDELYITNCDAEQFGQKMAYKCANQTFEAFIIDRHGGRLTDIGSGLTVERQYAEALSRYNVRSRRTGSGFIAGNDDVEAGVEAIRGWLKSRDGAGPTLRILAGRLANTEWEFRHYRYKRVGGIITDKPEERGRVHQMANCRYLALARPKWQKPVKVKAPEGAAVKIFRAKQKAKKKAAGPGIIRLGPGKGG